MVWEGTPSAQDQIPSSVNLASALSRAREARGAGRRLLGIPGVACKRGDAVHVLGADRATATPSWRDSIPDLRPPRAPACVYEVELRILYFVRTIRKPIPVRGESFGEPHRVGEQPALDGSNRNAKAHSWRDAAREQATDQSWRTLFVVEVTQDQPIHVSGGSRQTRDPLIEPWHSSGDDRSVRSMAHVPDQPFGDRDIRVALDGEVDERHALASRSGRSGMLSGSVLGQSISAKLRPASSRCSMSGIAAAKIASSLPLRGTERSLRPCLPQGLRESRESAWKGAPAARPHCAFSKRPPEAVVRPTCATRVPARPGA